MGIKFTRTQVLLKEIYPTKYMSIQKFKILLQKFIDQKITKEELLRLEELTSQNPEFEKEYDQYRSVIVGIKSNGLHEELRDIMDTEKPDDSDGF